jgi:gas vesicle protein
MAKKNNSGTLGAVILVVGGIIGAGTALLLAPQSGQRTRRQLVRCSRRARNQAEEMVKDAADSVSDVIEDLGNRTSDLFERGEEVAESWRSHLLESLDQGQKNLERQRKKLTQLWS